MPWRFVIAPLAGPGPAGVRKLIITRAGRTDELVPEESGKPNRWRMRRPIDAPADTRSITQILAILANLRADDFVADSQKDAAKFGLNQPLLEVAWETDRMHRLKVGAQVPRKPSYFAAIDRSAGGLHSGRRNAQALRSRVSRSPRHVISARQRPAARPHLEQAQAHRLARASPAYRQGTARMGRMSRDLTRAESTCRRRTLWRRPSPTWRPCDSPSTTARSLLSPGCFVRGSLPPSNSTRASPIAVCGSVTPRPQA